MKTYLFGSFHSFSLGGILFQCCIRQVCILYSYIYIHIYIVCILYSYIYIYIYIYIVCILYSYIYIVCILYSYIYIVCILYIVIYVDYKYVYIVSIERSSDQSNISNLSATLLRFPRCCDADSSFAAHLLEIDVTGEQRLAGDSTCWRLVFQGTSTIYLQKYIEI